MTVYANTINSLTERVLRFMNLGAIPRDSRFKMRDVEYMIRDTVGAKILASWGAARNAKEAMDIADSFVVTITKHVQQTTRRECFVVLDFDWINLPDGTALQSCRPAADTVNPLSLQVPSQAAFIPIPARFHDIYRNLPAQALEGHVGWANRSKKIFFTELCGQTLLDMGITDVDIDVVSVSEGVVGLDTSIPLPSDLSDAVVKEVAAFFMPLMNPVKDTANDNSPNQKPLRS